MVDLGTTWSVFSIFCTEPTASFTLRELARRTKLAHTSLPDHLERLHKEELITVSKEAQGSRIFRRYSANRTTAFFKYKRIHNRMAIEQSGLLNTLHETFQPGCIVLFGSYECGEDDETSDIDLFIEATPKNIDLKSYENILRRRIELHCSPTFKKYPAELKNNIINGTVLTGFLEAF